MRDDRLDQGSRSRTERRALHAEIAAAKHESFARRRELAAPFLDGPSSIEPASGLGRLDFSDQELFGRARMEANDLAALRRDEPLRDKRGLQYLLNGEDFAPDGPVLELGSSRILLESVSRYLGVLPILVDIQMTRATATELDRNSTQMFHLDGADITQVKAFVYLTPVDEQSGPFTALPAEQSDKVVEAFGYSGGRLSDEQVFGIVGSDTARSFLGPEGATALCDTTRCFHFGGRPPGPGRTPRELLMFHYVLPTSLILGAATDKPARMRQLQATGDEVWDALIGVAHS